MKTKYLLSALLVIIIQVMITGQTSKNQSSPRVLPVLEKSDPSENKEKAYPTVVSSETPSDKLLYTRSFANQLIKQAEEITMRETALRKEAATKKDEEKKKLLAAANDLMMQATVKQILASEINGKLNAEQYSANSITFNKLIVKLEENSTVYNYASNLKLEAAFSMKQAKEMRQEAYSLKSLTARYGVMSNAEEKEIVALGKQQQAIDIVKKSLAVNLLPVGCDLAVK